MGFLLRFPLEFFLALGAGYHDFALATGDADGLAAAGAEEVTVFPVFDTVNHQKEPAVFLVALIDIPGEAATDGPNHQCIAQDKENLADPAALQESVDDACCHTHT